MRLRTPASLLRCVIVRWVGCLSVGFLAASSPLAAENPALVPDFANVAYGADPRNVLDLWQAPAEVPTPVFIYFHGGGFTGGDKSGCPAQAAGLCRKMGISFVSANYRLVSGPAGAPFPAPMLDGARVVQFLRANTWKWNLDPRRIAIGGGSAGGDIALWVALHDDLADPKAADPVLRESSRVACVISWDGQSSNDPHLVSMLGGPKTDHPSLLPLYGVKTRAELETPAMRKTIEEASAVNHATRDDPPVLLIYGQPMTALPLPETVDWGTAIHHPFFGKLLKDKLDPLGVPCEFYHGGARPPPNGLQDFLGKYLMTAPGEGNRQTR